MENLLLEVECLHVFFNHTHLLKGISFFIKKGEIVGLVGESGSGKSLTSLAITGLLPSYMITEGKISFYKENKTYDLRSSEINIIRGHHITMIFQDSLLSLNPVLKCGMQATEGLRWIRNNGRKEAKKKIKAWFERVKLIPSDRFFYSYPHQISGGQRQRVMIASSLSIEPDLLIADEPTTALDPIMQKEVIDTLRKIYDETGISILFISHDLHLVRSFCHRMYIMYDGQIIESGYPEQIFKMPRESYTKSLLLSIPEVRKKEMRKDDTNETVVLSVKNLSVSYVKNKIKHKVLNGISFEVKKNESVGIVGVSGQGKTTLIRSLTLLQPYDEGEIFFNGVNLLKLSNRQLRKLRSSFQIIFQESKASFHPSMPIGKQIFEPVKLHNVFKSRQEMMDYIKILLEATELQPDCLQRYPHQLSGGQLQRLQIVRAMALKPILILLDEAISALDIRLKKQILDLLLSLQEKFNLTFLFVSHELSYVRYFCDRIYVLHDGKLLEGKSTDEVLNQPEHNITFELIKASFF
ncbi:MAG: ABC transporter ATP-binding protein [Bacteroidales bacterium]|nr:ABC transporter ATP-binding protein [Bacteroidales bacterium]